MKILIVNPHLSTGGCPEYLYQFILNNKNRQKSVDSKSKNSPRKAQLEKCEKYYNFYFHNFKKNYR